MAFYRKRYSRKGYRRTSYSKKAVARKARKSAARPTIRNKAVKLMVKREISRVAENKTASNYQPGLTLYSTANASWDSTNVITLSPGSASGINISQGTGQGNRVGNKIRIKKAMFRGVLVPFPYDPATNPNPSPQQVRMVFFYRKQTPTTKPGPKADFLQLGNTSNSLQNDLMDIVSPFNKDVYRILGTRTFKLGYSQFWGEGGGGAIPGDVAHGFYANNEFKYNCNFSVNIAKMMPELVQFSDASVEPTSRGLFCAFILCRADGSANLAAYAPCGVQFVTDYEYEDI